jgi:RND family efflux transporter MFP subunit
MKNNWFVIGLLILVSSKVSFANDVRGIINAEQDVLIASELQGRITQLTVREGDNFTKGEVLIAFDCTLEKAELSAARAEQDIKQLEYENHASLYKLNASSELTAEVAKAQYRKAKALALAKQAVVNRCQITAPYNGSVSEKYTNNHEIATYNQKLIRIVSSEIKDIELIIPSQWLGAIAINQAFNFSIEEIGAFYPARITRIAPQIDAISQSVKVYAEFDRNYSEILPGMSGIADLIPNTSNPQRD